MLSLRPDYGISYTGLRRSRRLQPEYHEHVASRDCYVLVPSGLVADWVRPDRTAGLKSPEQLAGLGIDREAQYVAIAAGNVLLSPCS